MEDRNAWRKFQQTGRVEDYLAYTAAHKRCIAAIGDSLLRRREDTAGDRPERRFYF